MADEEWQEVCSSFALEILSAELNRVGFGRPEVLTWFLDEVYLIAIQKDASQNGYRVWFNGDLGRYQLRRVVSNSLNAFEVIVFDPKRPVFQPTARIIPEPKLVEIFVCPDQGLPMVLRSEVLAIAGVGLDGDRYALGKGSWSKSKRLVIRQVSLIAKEAIDRANVGQGVNFTSADTRRNLVTVGVNLNYLVGKEFRVGAVRMKGVELCTPCVRPSTLAKKPDFEKLFNGEGGLRAELLDSGQIKFGDVITVALSNFEEVMS